MGGGRHKRGVARHKVTRKVQKRKKAKVTIKLKGSPEQVLKAAHQITGSEPAAEQPKSEEPAAKRNC